MCSPFGGARVSIAAIFASKDISPLNVDLIEKTLV